MLRWLTLLALLTVSCGSPATPTTTAPAATRSQAPSPARAAATNSAQGACRYVFPIQPSSAARYSEFHHDYPATDILAAAGSNVVSPIDGIVDWVVRVDEYRGSNDEPALRGGLSFAVIGDDGNRYYGSHLRDVQSDVETGARIAAGELVGHVGTSGNAGGTGPHLHLGISKPTTPDDWQIRRGQINPFQYLNAWRDGHALTPKVSGARTASCRRSS